jgi:hypothetical protein
MRDAGSSTIAISADVLVGAIGGDGGAGRAYAYQGGPIGLPKAPRVILSGAGPRADFGGPLASAGDVNGDGFADVVIGAIGAAGTGQVYRISVCNPLRPRGACLVTRPARPSAPPWQLARRGTRVSLTSAIPGRGLVVAGRDVHWDRCWAELFRQRRGQRFASRRRKLHGARRASDREMRPQEGMSRDD